MSERFVVVGGDAAGMSAASKARRDAPDLEVVVLERGEWASYGACGIPYYVEGVIHDLEELVVADPTTIVDERGIDLRRREAVVGVDPDREVVTVEAPSRRYELAYDHLLLATGGRAAMPDVPGTDLQGVFGVRDLEAGRALRDYIVHVAPPTTGDGVADREAGRDQHVQSIAGGAAHDDRLRSYIEAVDPEAAVVVGADKIGIEMAEAFAARDLSVRVVDAGRGLLPHFGDDAAGVAAARLDRAGVDLHRETAVRAFRGDGGRVTAVETDAGVLDAAVVLVDVGVEPNVELAVDAGADRGPTGAIATDAHGRTSAPDVYAAGDCAEKRHLLADEPVQWPFALAANRGGRAVGATVAGDPTPVGGVVGTLIMKTFGLELARSGLLAEEARAAGFDPVERTITTITRAHYHPGWSRMVVHAVADRADGRLLGATLAAEEGAAHRINAVATALHAGMDVESVGALDLGYAPPFGPVWDPVLTAAKVLDEALG